MEMEIDRLISGLPDDIAEEILSRMSTKDAVRTSILSRRWRHKWTTTPSLVFIDMFNSIGELVSIIDHVFSHHVGSIHKFELYYDFRREESEFGRKNIRPDQDIDRCFLHLSRSHITELSLMLSSNNKERYMLPSCIFSFQNLTKLELSCCSLRPPATFKGFENLKTLNLMKVAMAQDVLEILICSPVLESAYLWVYLGDSVENINVDAPNLLCFGFRGKFADITFRNTSRLSVVDICLWDDNDYSMPIGISRMPMFFNGLMHVERLTLNQNFLENLALDGLPREYPLHNIQYLSMEVNFNNQEGISAALCLLISAPNLQELSIHERAVNSDENVKYPNFLEDANMNFVFFKLRRVKMDNIVGCKGEIKFINYILSTSPVLEMMTIHPYFQSSKLLVEKSLCFEQCAEHADIIVEEPYVRCTTYYGQVLD